MSNLPVEFLPSYARKDVEISLDLLGFLSSHEQVEPDMKSFTGTALCLEPIRGGHYCHKSKGHGKRFGSKQHVCNCKGLPTD